MAWALPIAAQVHPTLSKSPMTPDQIAVYRAFLISYLHVDSTPGNLNLAQRTSVFDPVKEYEECLDGIRFEKVGSSTSGVHRFDPQAVPSNIALVDAEEQKQTLYKTDPHWIYRGNELVNETMEKAFAAGFLTLSEIAFDKKHRYAVFRYWFECWGLCGSGGTVIFGKQNGVWVMSKRSCMHVAS